MGLGAVVGRPSWLMGCGEGWAGERPSWAGLSSPSPLFPSLFIYRELRERKRDKRRLEEEFGHVVKLPGLIKMSLFRENRKGQD